MLELKDIRCPPVFDILNMSFSFGKAYWLKGPNGIGKTTLLNILAGLQICESGDVCYHKQSVCHDLYRYQSEIYYLGHTLGLSTTMSIQDWVQWVEAQWEPQDSAHSSHLSDQSFYRSLVPEKDLNRAIGSLSAGQKKRLAMLPLWAHSKKIYLLDEPFNALDDKMCERLADRIATLANTGNLVVFASHYTFPGELIPELIDLEQM